jgi:hypothetical protein
MTLPRTTSPLVNGRILPWPDLTCRMSLEGGSKTWPGSLSINLAPQLEYRNYDKSELKLLNGPFVIP